MASNSDTHYLDLLSLSALTRTPYFLIQGGKQTGKTSILFQQAILASMERREILLISPAAPDKLPSLPPGSNPQPEHTKLIQLKYPSTARDLIQLLAEVHENSFRPGLVLLDCLEVYAREGGEVDIGYLAKLLALLRDAVHFWCSQTEKGSIPIFVASEINHQVISKWLPHTVKIERERLKSFKLKVESPVKVSCRYSLENSQFLKLTDPRWTNEE